MAQNRANTGLSGPPVIMPVMTVARHGSSTRITALRISVTSAISGVATRGNPRPSAPCTSPARAITNTTHSTTPADKDSNPGMR